MLTKIYARIQGYIQSDEGATAIEYGLIAGGISLAIVAAVFAFGGDLRALFESIGESMNAVQTNAEENLE